MWSVGSILTGLLSFMLESTSTTGSMASSDEDKRKYSKYSKIFNRKNKQFLSVFADIAEKDKDQNIVSAQSSSTGTISTPVSPTDDAANLKQPPTNDHLFPYLGALIAASVVLFGILRLAR